MKDGDSGNVSVGMVRNLVKSILEGTYDDATEDRHLNKILYELIPA